LLCSTKPAPACGTPDWSVVHRTVSGAQADPTMNSSLSGKSEGTAAKIHRTVRRAPDCLVSQRRPRQRSAAQSASDAWPEPTITWSHRTVWCAPDSVRCAKGAEGATVGFARKRRRSSTGQELFMSGVHRSIRCTTRQKARIAFLLDLQRILAVLRL
jgi:hypothetical protein